MTRPVTSISEEASIFEAAKIMAHSNFGALVILHAEKPKGILTERDILLRVTAKGLDTHKVKVKEIMTRNIISVSSDATLLQIGKTMSKHRFRHVIVTKEGKVIGIITATDLINMFAS